MANLISYHVAARYTAGSPAMVPEDTARRVAAQEKAAYLRYKEGMYGEYQKKVAEERGLEAIAYSTMEQGRRIIVNDLITGARFVVPIKEWTGQYWYKRTDRKKYLTPDAVSHGN